MILLLQWSHNWLLLHKLGDFQPACLDKFTLVVQKIEQCLLLLRVPHYKIKFCETY